MDSIPENYDPLEYVRGYYHVPAYKNRVVFAGERRGVIAGASGPHVKVWLDGDKLPGVYHPSDLRYTEETSPLPKLTRSQRDYRAYLNSECNESFMEFMRNPYWDDLRRRT